ncbi:hypothetical protein F2Q69_00039679 [Brassica cretica]|uniref:Uncharacterized protein n=1 Tax=Brassica cretica TaxID=69181 RepID=A0A8S9NGU1_BRACR|nr:hypothetical protein F2Q69_00039679 [Brassica cretica]
MTKVVRFPSKCCAVSPPSMSILEAYRFFSLMALVAPFLGVDMLWSRVRGGLPSFKGRGRWEIQGEGLSLVEWRRVKVASEQKLMEQRCSSAMGENGSPSFRVPEKRCVGPTDPSQGSEPGGSCLQEVGVGEGPVVISEKGNNLKRFFRLQSSRFQNRE